MPVKLFFSNTIETLARAFADHIAAGNAGFDPALVIIPNPYLKKWLQMEIARINGISMNLDFRFMNDGLWDLARSVDPDAGESYQIDQSDLQIMLYHALSPISTGSISLKPLADYLHVDSVSTGPDHERKKWQLSLRLARYFLEYEFYRGDMIRGWIQGTLTYNTEMERSQRELYHAVFKKNGVRDTMFPGRRTLPQYWNMINTAASTGILRKAFMFGAPLLTPFHARMIFELGRHIDIFMYQLNPCSEFWEDITTPREDRWKRIRSIGIRELKEGEALVENENENLLLKLWGKTGRETVKLLGLLEEAGSTEMSVTSEWLVSPPGRAAKGLLGTVQDQILRRSSLGDPEGPVPQDRSIQVAACPELFREAEAVYNSVLYNLEHDSTLMMTDIAVMVPDMTAYGPVLHSVFSRRPKRITYSMIDSTASSDSLMGKAILTLLGMASGSFTRAEVFELVFNRCFLEARGMTVDDAEVWLSWVDALNIFHDFKHSDDIDPERNLYTWHQGLLRTRFGRIMQAPSDYRRDGIFLDYKNIVPYTDLNTGNQNLIDAFNCAIELVHARIKGLEHFTGSGADWITIIDSLVGDFLAIPSDMPEEELVYIHLRQSLERLRPADRLKKTNIRAVYSLTFMKEFIAENLTGIPSSSGSYLTGGINISAMVPHRQIPFKIIYLMGMQEGIFPGSGDTSTLNLMNVRRTIGDMTRPDINRYLFLETVLSAREKLYITYLSRDLQKDQDFYPNSVTGQLLTYLSKHVMGSDFSIMSVPPSGSSDHYLSGRAGAPECSDILIACDNGAAVPVNYSDTDRLLLLQNAAARYRFDPATSEILAQRLKVHIPDFTLSAPSAAADVENAEITLRDLAGFLKNPVESTLRWHLSLHDEDEDDLTALEDEPFYSVYPYNYLFMIDTLDYFVRGRSKTDTLAFFNDYYRHARLMSATPGGAYGSIDMRQIASGIAERIRDDGAFTDFIESRTGCRFYQNITFGSNTLKMQPDRSFPPLLCDLAIDNRTSRVALSGSLPLIWQNPETGEWDTMVITNRVKPSVNSVITPFLWYVAASSGLDEDLRELIGNAGFTIHVLHRGGFASYQYRITREDSEEYLRRLLTDFLDESGFDLLPIQIVSDKKLTQPHEMNPLADTAEKQRYREELIRMITDDAEKDYPSYRPMKICELINAEVPPDAYDIVRKRLGLLLRPFTGEEAP